MESAAMAEPEISLLSLPDDALLAVLAFLPARQLFVCRVACRRLRDLCLHSQLWRAATVRQKGVLRAALALAPCIGTIAGVDVQALEPLVAATACTVSALQLRVCDDKTATLALALLSRLSTVCSGLRLRKLTLGISGPLTERTLLMLKAVYTFHGLQDLTFNRFPDQELNPAEWGELDVLPSLTKLKCTSYCPSAFLKLLLRTHCATLEQVDLEWREGVDVPWSSLASLSRLRSLLCYQGDGLSQLAALPNLSSVELESYNETGEIAFAPGALEFLFKAPHLLTVKLHVPNHHTHPLLALANSSSASSLEKLSVDSWDDLENGTDVFEMLPSVLHKFCSLKCLIVNKFSELPYGILKAVSPTSLPCLTILVWNNTNYEDERWCLHATLHDPYIQDLLLRNPRLHLRLMRDGKYGKSCKSCSWCRWGCHARLCRTARVSLSAHRRMSGCPSDCYRAFKASNRDRLYPKPNRAPL